VTVTTTAAHCPGAHLPAPAGAAARLGPLPRCPRCAGVLDGGPVAYHCAACGRGVMAADIDTDYHPRPGLAALAAVPAGGCRAEEGSP